MQKESTSNEINATSIIFLLLSFYNKGPLCFYSDRLALLTRPVTCLFAAIVYICVVGQYSVY